MKYITSILFLLFFAGATAQHTSLENRLYYQQVDSVELYGAGHYQIKLSVIKFSHLLTADEMKKTAQKFAYQNHFSDSIPKVNPRVKEPHYYVGYHEETYKDYWNNTMCYFFYDIKDSKEHNVNVLAIIHSVASAKSDDIDVEMLSAIIDYKNKEKLKKNTLGGREFDFLGRKITLDDECYWTGLGIVRCPNLGQMNWSLHTTLADAQASINQQAKLGEYAVNKKPINEENTTYKRIGERDIELIFEGKRTKAREITFNMHYQHPILKSLTKDKKLIVYYIATTVRGYHIACVLSYWDDNPKLPNTQLPAFISEFVRLK